MPIVIQEPAGAVRIRQQQGGMNDGMAVVARGE